MAKEMLRLTPLGWDVADEIAGREASVPLKATDDAVAAVRRLYEARGYPVPADPVLMDVVTVVNRFTHQLWSKDTMDRLGPRLADVLRPAGKAARDPEVQARRDKVLRDLHGLMKGVRGEATDVAPEWDHAAADQYLDWLLSHKDRDGIRELQEFMHAAGRSLAEFSRDEYAPGVSDLRDRVLAGAEPERYRSLTEAQQRAWREDLVEFGRQFTMHGYTKQDAAEVVAAIAAVDDRMLDAVRENIARTASRYNRGPVHLVALEQQLLALRLNAEAERRMSGLPGALQPGTIRALRDATPFCWSPECVEAVAQAAATLPGSARPSGEALGPVAGPGACGWWWFEDPVPVRTTSTEEPVVALLWRREYHDRPSYLGGEEVMRELADMHPPSGYVTWFTCFVHALLPSRGRQVLAPVPTAAWSWPDAWSLEQALANLSRLYEAYERRGWFGTERAGHDVTVAAQQWFSRLWMAGGLWLEQRVITRVPTAVPRQPGRAMQREHKLDHVPLVQVVHLRRAVPAGHEETDEQGRRYDKWRWTVSGHWREQWYPSRGRHEAVWIDPYLKGPEDAPLKPKGTVVYAVDR